MASVIFEEQLELPLDIRSYADFRKWAVSDEFPEVGRIDFVGGNIEVELSPEELYTHNAVKVQLIAVLANLAKVHGQGELFSRVRLTSEPSNLSTEPDVVYFRYETLDSGVVKLVPKDDRHDEFIAIEGAPDMIAEIVSDGSVSKDTLRLPEAYFEAGVREYWLIDARKEDLVFRIHGRGVSGFILQSEDAEGFQVSAVFGERFRLDRQRDRRGHWKYDLKTIE